MPLSDGHSEGGSGPREVPTGVEREEVLLESLAGVPMVSQAWCLPRPSGGVELKVPAPPAPVAATPPAEGEPEEGRGLNTARFIPDSTYIANLK